MSRAALSQPGYETSLMGVVQGALDHFGLAGTPGRAFVLSGHAFVINVHETLCPSGPYCWNYAPFRRLLRNLGLDMTVVGELIPEHADAAEISALEDRVRETMAAGSLCSLFHLDNQLLLGEDDQGFLLTQPWGDRVDTTPARLTFGSWRECRSGPPVTFLQLSPCETESQRGELDALDFALDAWRQPGAFTVAPSYGFGPRAYDNWLAGVDAGHAGEHGNWWNGVVWSECRERASEYFQDLAAADFPGPVDQEQARQLAKGYRAVARLLRRASDQTAPAPDKRRFVAEARDLEAGCVETIAALRA